MFGSNGAGADLSVAQVFQRTTYPVIGRFSIGGGNPLAVDGRNVFHSMALLIRTENGQEWRLAMDHTPIFPVADVASFVALQRATTPDPSDVTDRGTVAWTGPHRAIDAGRLVMTAVRPEETGTCRDLNFDPTILPPGIDTSDDPLLAARSKAYSTSFTDRAAEGAGPSAASGNLAQRAPR